MSLQNNHILLNAATLWPKFVMSWPSLNVLQNIQITERYIHEINKKITKLTKPINWTKFE